MSWFDRKEKAPGILSNILSEDVTNLNGLTTETVAVLSEAALCLGEGIALSVFWEWRMALTCLAAIPFLVLGSIIMSKLTYRASDVATASTAKKDINSDKQNADPYEHSNALLSDVILNYRTVISFG